MNKDDLKDEIPIDFTIGGLDGRIRVIGVFSYQGGGVANKVMKHPDETSPVNFIPNKIYLKSSDILRDDFKLYLSLEDKLDKLEL